MCVSVGSLIATNTPHWGEMLTMGGGCTCVGAKGILEVFGLILKIAVKISQFFKKSKFFSLLGNSVFSTNSEI